MRISGRVVLITGASEGIGAACVQAFRSRGAEICLTARSADKLRKVTRAGDLVIPADLLTPDAPKTIVDAVLAKHGRLDILINNAGAGLYQPAHTADPALAHQLFDLNLFAPLALVRETAAHMKTRREGTIVNVSSIAGAVPLPWFTIYSASKAALITLTDGLRMELREWGIHCISVLPGYVKTNFQQNIYGGNVPPALGGMRQRMAITPEQCAEAIARGVERDARTVVTPASGWVLVAGWRLFPAIVEQQLRKFLRSQSAQGEVAGR